MSRRNVRHTPVWVPADLPINAAGDTRPGFECAHELENGGGRCSSNVFRVEDAIVDHSCVVDDTQGEGIKMRTWQMFASRPERVVEGREFINIGGERTVRFRGGSPIAVELTEDPDGRYWGWVELPDSARSNERRVGIPTMIQPHEGMFRMQSPDGFGQNIDRGYGEVVRMSCRAID